jgi:hypothetical protein
VGEFQAALESVSYQDPATRTLFIAMGVARLRAEQAQGFQRLEETIAVRSLKSVAVLL